MNNSQNLGTRTVSSSPGLPYPTPPRELHSSRLSTLRLPQRMALLTLSTPGFFVTLARIGRAHRRRNALTCLTISRLSVSSRLLAGKTRMRHESSYSARLTRSWISQALYPIGLRETRADGFAPLCQEVNKFGDPTRPYGTEVNAIVAIVTQSPITQGPAPQAPDGLPEIRKFPSQTASPATACTRADNPIMTVA